MCERIVNGVNQLKELFVFQMFGYVDLKTFGRMWSLTFSGLVDIKGKRMLSTRYGHCRISGHSRDIRNTTVDIDQWNTPCAVSIPIFFIVLKLDIYFILHVSSFEGIISL